MKNDGRRKRAFVQRGGYDVVLCKTSKTGGNSRFDYRFDEKTMRICELEISEVATALKTGSEKMYYKILDCLPSKVARALTETMEFLGPVLISDVRAAQEHFVQIADQVLQ